MNQTLIEKLKEIIAHYKLNYSPLASKLTTFASIQRTTNCLFKDLSALEQHPETVITDEDIRDYSFKNYGRLSHFSTIGIIETAIKEFVQSRQSKEPSMEVYDEREALFQAFDKIRASFKGRHWLMEGRGCYPYDDERYKEEVRYIMDEFEEINTSLWKQIKSKSFEYKEMIRKNILAELQSKEPVRDEPIIQDEQNLLDWKGEYEYAVEEIENLQRQLKDAENEISQLESELRS